MRIPAKHYPEKANAYSKKWAFDHPAGVYAVCAKVSKYINDGKTIVTSPHKIYGPETNDLVLQLRKKGIDKVILGGMSANLCTESHMRELIEQGFEVAVVSDSTAAAQVEEGDGYAAALVNYRFIANTVWTTEKAKLAMQGNVGK